MLINNTTSAYTGYGMTQQTQMRSSKAASTEEEMSASSLIEENDSDGDGSLSLSEIGMPEEMFNEMDSDGDGLLTEDELENGKPEGPPPGGGMGGPGSMGSIEDMIAESDEDGDGALSIEETDFTEEMFSEIDTDEDGVLTQTELEEGRPEPPPQGETGGLELTGDVESLLNQFNGASAYEESLSLTSSYSYGIDTTQMLNGLQLFA